MGSPRQARCECGRVNPSSEALPGYKSLPFFEYRGPGSLHATAICKCGYYASAHAEQPGRKRFACDAFESRGAHEFDSFYCGCRGWD